MKQKKYVYTYGLSEFELGVLNADLYYNYERYICDEDFEAMLESDAIALFINPAALTKEQFSKLNAKFSGDSRTVIAFTAKPEYEGEFTYSVIDLKTAVNEKRTNVMRVLYNVNANASFVTRFDKFIERKNFPKTEEFIAVTLKNDYDFGDNYEWVEQISALHFPSGETLELEIGDENSICEAMEALADFHPESIFVTADAVCVIDALRKLGISRGYYLNSNRIFVDIEDLTNLLYSANIAADGSWVYFSTCAKYVLGDCRIPETAENIAKIYKTLRETFAKEYGLNTLEEISDYFYVNSGFTEKCLDIEKSGDFNEETKLSVLHECFKNRPEMPRPVSEKGTPYGVIKILPKV